MRTILFVLLTAWAIAFFGSFIMFFVAPDKGVGLDAGLNRLSQFMIWQGIATVLAVMCLVVRWSGTDEINRRMAAIPALGFGVLVLGLGGLFLWACLNSVDPSGAYVPPKQPTEVPDS